MDTTPSSTLPDRHFKCRAISAFWRSYPLPQRRAEQHSDHSRLGRGHAFVGPQRHTVFSLAPGRQAPRCGSARCCRPIRPADRRRSRSRRFFRSRYAQALGREFDLVVPGNAMKFAETEPAPHQFSFCAADRIVAYAQANGMKVRGHNLVWRNDLPSWLTSGNYSSAEAASILQEHLRPVVGRYKGQLIYTVWRPRQATAARSSLSESL